nr:hypothetical protein CFP56_64905 [Quercus suber]
MPCARRSLHDREQRSDDLRGRLRLRPSQYFTRKRSRTWRGCLLRHGVEKTVSSFPLGLGTQGGATGGASKYFRTTIFREVEKSDMNDAMSRTRGKGFMRNVVDANSEHHRLWTLCVARAAAIRRSRRSSSTPAVKQQQQQQQQQQADIQAQDDAAVGTCHPLPTCVKDPGRDLPWHNRILRTGMSVTGMQAARATSDGQRRLREHVEFPSRRTQE